MNKKYLDFLLQQEKDHKLNIKTVEESKTYIALSEFAEQITEYLGGSNKCILLFGDLNENGQEVICILKNDQIGYFDRILEVFIKGEKTFDKSGEIEIDDQYLLDKIQQMINTGLIYSLKGR
jgi:hypothetical protein